VRNRSIAGHSIETDAVPGVRTGERRAYRACILQCPDDVRDSELVGDRFVIDGDGRWRDLATGRDVELVLRAIDGRWRAWERALADEWHDGRSGRLVDFGRTGADAWFEARTANRRRRAIDGRADTLIAAALARAMNRGESYVRVGGDARHRAGAVLFIAARAARLAGYVPLRASLPLSAVFERVLIHRHIAFLVDGKRDRAPAAARWWRAASMTPRHHLVIDCSARSDAGIADAAAGASQP
jgi:hypothetical protein